MSSEHILYELACGTIAFGRLSDATTLECRCHIHNTREPIVAVQTSEWLSNCNDCAWRRWWGNDRDKARDESRRHWLRKPSHKTTFMKRRRHTAIMAQIDLQKKVAEMGGKWYNQRVVPGTIQPEVVRVDDEIPPF